MNENQKYSRVRQLTLANSKTEVLPNNGMLKEKSTIKKEKLMDNHSQTSMELKQSLLPVSKNNQQEEFEKPIQIEIPINQEKPVGKVDSTKKHTLSDNVKTIKGINKNSIKKLIVKKNKEGFTQDLIQVERVVGGIIQTKDKRYVKILEIAPTNFHFKSIKERNDIISTFESYFKSAPVRLQFKSMSIPTDTSDLISNIKRYRSKEVNAKVIEQSVDYEKHIKNITGKTTISKRYFIIFEYEGDNEGKKRSDIESIHQSMLEVEYTTERFLNLMGNSIIRHQDENLFACEILYQFYNRKTAQAESITDRILRIASDDKDYHNIPEPNNVNIEDFIAPKGIKYVTPSVFIMDGMYYTYLCFEGDKHPELVSGAWLDMIAANNSLDIDIYTKKLDSYSTSEKLGRSGRFKKLRAKDNENNENAHAETESEIKTTEHIQKQMRAGQDLYDVVIMITLYSSSLKELRMKKNTLSKIIKSNGIICEESYFWCEEGLQMAAPLLNINKDIFNRNKHNYLTKSLSSTYLFTGYELFDSDGVLFGINANNMSLSVINNFNTDKYKNANIAILGTSGAGKTFSEQALGYYMRLSGKRVFYILPEKGYEYKKGCREIGGTYIKLSPSSETCINIMEIRIASEIDESLIEDDAVPYDSSLLTQKVIELKTFIQLLMGKKDMSIEEENDLDIVLTELYADFGISTDNNSLYTNDLHTNLKVMPIIGDLYNKAIKNPRLERIVSVLKIFVFGSCKNMNAQTNVDLSNRYNVIDVDKRDVGEKLLPAFLYIAFNCVTAIIKESRLENDALFLDEIWRMMVIEASANLVKESVKLIRGYGGCVIVATQELNDFLGKNMEYGKAILNNTEIKLLLNMKDNEIDEVTKLFKLSNNDAKNIKQFQRGQGLLVTNDNKIPVYIKASQKTTETFTNDSSVLRKIKENKNAKAILNN